MANVVDCGAHAGADYAVIGKVASRSYGVVLAMSMCSVAVMVVAVHTIVTMTMTMSAVGHLAVLIANFLVEVVMVVSMAVLVLCSQVANGVMPHMFVRVMAVMVVVMMAVLVTKMLVILAHIQNPSH